MFPKQDLGFPVLVANFKTKVLVAVLYANQDRAPMTLPMSLKCLDSKNRDYKIVMAGDFNINTERRREFCKIMAEIYYMTSRNNIAQYTKRTRTRIDAIFSACSVRTCL
ncbi:uncharacterized protein CEXT_499261 [Caerostris extrusa]|uniref:Endonuclease/exonuclease/phosphatase domain-containing protein n=1 Tax=Caerostris extrusa TaxID=172846 RepID=A0AAV4V5U9_CAEEX|nr:uncharacterized protein CEXT_499261 [Caerostris extrusa]